MSVISLWLIMHAYLWVIMVALTMVALTTTLLGALFGIIRGTE
jgi:hypothetical protein